MGLFAVSKSKRMTSLMTYDLLPGAWAIQPYVVLIAPKGADCIVAPSDADRGAGERALQEYDVSFR